LNAIYEQLDSECGRGKVKGLIRERRSTIKSVNRRIVEERRIMELLNFIIIVIFMIPFILRNKK